MLGPLVPLTTVSGVYVLTATRDKRPSPFPLVIAGRDGSGTQWSEDEDGYSVRWDRGRRLTPVTLGVLGPQEGSRLDETLGPAEGREETRNQTSFPSLSFREQHSQDPLGGVSGRPSSRRGG